MENNAETKKPSNGDSQDKKPSHEIESLYNEYSHYSTYRNEINDGELKVSESTDKAILTISSLGLSLLLFLTKALWDQSDLQSHLTLKLSWIFFALTLASVVLSLSLSGVIYKLNRRRCDELLNNRYNIIEALQNGSVPEDKEDFQDASCIRVITNLLHFSAPVLLLAGLLSIVLFFNTNFEVFQYESSSTSGERATDQVPGAPSPGSTSTSSTEKARS